MNAWLIYDAGQAKRNEHYIKLWKRCCNDRGINLRLLLTNSIMAKCSKEGFDLLSSGSTLEKVDFTVYRAASQVLHEHIEIMGIIHAINLLLLVNH